MVVSRTMVARIIVIVRLVFIDSLIFNLIDELIEAVKLIIIGMVIVLITVRIILVL